ncbi:hypothetical protein Q5P01_013045 [Channa striata]|uniref:CLN6 transmembrane ER protein b n=1 Tax=Channa striata TaxID=64152 RepID=A0AA88STS2_CHASR|nr:hypothetical protein Q5P01_013045 [Channa striata]
MHPSARRRQSLALHAAAFMCSRSAASAEKEPPPSKPRFHLNLWLSFTAQNWILDVGRTVVMLVLPADWCPLSRPGAAEYLHFLYGVTTPLVLLRMLELSPRKLPRLAVHLCIIAVVMGTSLRLVADSVTRHLLVIGCQLHLSLGENPVMKNLKPSSLIEVFELLFYYDNTLGHLLWYLPLFLVLLLFFSGCFCRRQQEKMPTAAWIMLVPNAAYYWYLISEGQTFIVFIFTFFAMTATVMHQKRRGMVPDGDGVFMLCSFSAALVLVLVWVMLLWNDSVLWRNNPGLIYIPQPRAVFTLRLCQDAQT